MSTSNRISEVIPAAVQLEVTTKLNECKTALAPYLFALTDKERHDLFKMGDKTVAIVQKVKSYLDTNPEFAPGYMQTAEFIKDEKIASELTPLQNLAQQLFTDIDDTCLLAGSEALSEALFYYGSVREAANKGVAAAKPIYDDLSQRFSKKTKIAKV
jgi:hypothetical protein